jgi:hypothetical protein
MLLSFSLFFSLAFHIPRRSLAYDLPVTRDLSFSDGLSNNMASVALPVAASLGGPSFSHQIERRTHTSSIRSLQRSLVTALPLLRSLPGGSVVPVRKSGMG